MYVERQELAGDCLLARPDGGLLRRKLTLNLNASATIYDPKETPGF
jgi:hypothetical protein